MSMPAGSRDALLSQGGIELSQLPHAPPAWHASPSHPSAVGSQNCHPNIEDDFGTEELFSHDLEANWRLFLPQLRWQMFAPLSQLLWLGRCCWDGNLSWWRSNWLGALRPCFTNGLPNLFMVICLWESWEWWDRHRHYRSGYPVHENYNSRIAVAIIPWAWSLCWSTSLAVREVYEAPATPNEEDLAKRLFEHIYQFFQVPEDFAQTVREASPAELWARLARVPAKLSLRSPAGSIYWTVAGMISMTATCSTLCAVDAAGGITTPASLLGVPFALASIGCLIKGLSARAAIPIEGDTENWKNIVSLCNRMTWVPEPFSSKVDPEFLDKLHELQSRLQLPHDPQFWKKVDSLGANFGVFGHPGDAAPANLPRGLLLEYASRFRSGDLTAGLLGKQLSLGFLSKRSCCKVCLVMLEPQVFMLLMIVWGCLPALIRSNRITSLHIPVIRMLKCSGWMGMEPHFTANWVMFGIPCNTWMWMVVPWKFRNLCSRLISSHKALNICLQAPEIAARNCLPYVDVRDYRQLAMWRAARALFTSAAARDLQSLQLELGVVVVGMLITVLFMFGSVWMEGEWTSSIWNCSVVVCLTAGVLEIVPALYCGAKLNSVIKKQVNLVRMRCHHISFREVLVAGRSTAGTTNQETELARSRLYAQAMLTDLERSGEGFSLLGMVKLDFARLIGGVVAAYSCFIPVFRAFQKALDQHPNVNGNNVTSATM